MQTITNKKISPIAWVSTVYFAMGLPMVMISDVSLLLFKDMGIADKQITFWVSLLILPWSLKPLFSPLMEIFGTKKQYVLLTELVSAIILGFVAAGLGVDNFFGTCVIFMAIMAISGSIHDIAGDGTYMEYLTAKEQSQYIGWQGAFYNIAKVLAKGGLVYLVGRLSQSYGVLYSWKIVFFIAAAIMLALVVHHLFLLPGKVRNKRQEYKDLNEAIQEFWHVFVSFFRKRHIVFYLIFILLYRFTEGLAIKVAPLFLKADRAVGGLGLSNEQFGLIYGTVGTIAFILGSIASGYFIGHKGLKKVLFTLAIIFNFPFIVFFLLATFAPTDVWWTAIGIAFEQFGYGFGFVGLNLFMMQQVAPGPHQMAHYAIANSLMNLSFMIPGLVSGTLSDAFGYRIFFLVALFVAIPGIICAKIVPFTYDDKGNRITQK